MLRGQRKGFNTAFVAALLLVASSAAAELVGTVPSGSDSNFVRVDSGTGAATVVGATGFANIAGVAARRSDNAVFGAQGQVSGFVQLGAIITIDPNTGAGTLVGPSTSSPNGPIRSLAFSPGDTLYAACNSSVGDVADSLCTVDQGTGQAIFVAFLQYPGSSILTGVEGLAFNSGGTLYAATGPSYSGGAALFTVNPINGQATLVGLIRSSVGGPQLLVGIAGLEFAGSTLYATTYDGRLITLDPATAVYTVVGSHGIAGVVQGLGFRDVPPTPTQTRTFTALFTVTQTPTPTVTATATIPPCTLPGPGNECIPGGGSRSLDCMMEWMTDPATAPQKDLRSVKLVCYEGDPECDFDPDIHDNSCLFHAAICLNNHDPRLPLCSPADVGTFEVRRPNPVTATGVDSANVAALEGLANPGFGLPVVRNRVVVQTGTSVNQPDVCSSPAGLSVPLKLTSRGPRLARKVLRIRATSLLGKRDTDVLRLECRPSTCGNGIRESYEECDDGNRVNGDGCNQGCRVEAIPTPTATVTQTATITVTHTAGVAATVTSTATSTGTPTNTATATSTNVLPPTNTPLPTATSGGPTPTPTDNLPGIHVTLLSGGTCTGSCVGGSTNGNPCSSSFNCVSCLGTCVGGDNAGGSCSGNFVCPGGTCGPKQCIGGPNEGLACTSFVSCAGNCAAPKCVGGALAGASCAAASDCNGCSLTPPKGACANVQLPLFPLQLSLVGELRLIVGDPQPDGKRELLIPAASVKLQPVNVGTLGIACIGVASDAVGFVDCDGGASNLNSQLESDHNTVPGSPNNYGQRCKGGTNNGGACTSDANCPGASTALCAGLPDDPTCSATLLTPAGAEAAACLEGRRFCLAGSSAGNVCTADADCPGGTCSPLRCRDGANAGLPCATDVDCPFSACGAFVCRGGTNAGGVCAAKSDCPGGNCMPCTTSSIHPGVCNSPVRATQSGAFGPGDATVILPQTIQLIASDGSQNGPDGIACTADDTSSAAPAAVNVILTTGSASARVFDEGNTAGSVIAANVNCGASPCRASFTGKPFTCAALANGEFDGILVGAFPAFDTSSGDLVTTFQFDAVNP